MRYATVILGLLFFGWTDGALAIQPCVESEQEGCVEIDILAVRYDPKNELLVGLVSNAYDSADVASKVYEGVKRGTIALAEEGVGISLYFWGVDLQVPVSSMASYESNGERGSVVVAKIPENGDEVFPDLGAPQAAYNLKVQKGKGAFQIPWAYISDETYALLCTPDSGSLYPSSGNFEGGWISSLAWGFYRHLEDRPEWILVVMVMP